MARNILINSFKIFVNTSVIKTNQNQIRNIIFIRTFTSDEQNKSSGIISLAEYKYKHSPGIKFITPNLQKLLGITATDVKDLIKKYPKFRNFSSEDLEMNYLKLMEANVQNELILQYPMLLMTELIDEKLKIIQTLKVDINHVATLLLGNMQIITKVVKILRSEKNYVPYGNRIIYLSKLLNLPPCEIAEKMLKHYFVLTLPLEKVEGNIKLYLDYGIEPRSILRDCWSLRYNSQFSEQRLQRAMSANVSKLKTWMIRCKEDVLERCISRYVENRKILGNNATVEEYLSRRLDCSIENAQYITEKYPAIMKMSILKMKEILDFLFEQDYTPQHVYRVPRILVHSQETTKHRIELLKQLGHLPPSLAILCKSKRDFDKIVKKYVKRKKNEKSTKIDENEM